MRESIPRIGDKMYMKKCIINHKWQYMKLTDDEEKRLLANLRKDNKELMKECIKDAKEIISEEFTDIENIAIALFERLADAKYTRIQATLDEKISIAESGIADKEKDKLRQEKIDSDAQPVIDSETGLVV